MLINETILFEGDRDVGQGYAKLTTVLVGAIGKWISKTAQRDPRSILRNDPPVRVG